MTDIEVRDLRDQLTECETVIERGLATFVDVGTALLRIRDERLYQREYGDFESYCRSRWGFTDRRARQLMASAEVVGTIVPTGLPSPANEGQARELARVPEPERAEVWREAHERTEGKPTAAVVREIRQERTAPEPEPIAEIPGQTSIVDDDTDPLPAEIDEYVQQRVTERQRHAEYARLDSELDAEMAGTDQRFRSNFATAARRAGEVTTFDAGRLAEVFDGNWDRDVGDLLRILREWCDATESAHRKYRSSGLRVINGGGR